jgi:hypothetical protein
MVTRDRWYGGDRLAGLRRFAVAITVLNVLGHTVLGFEQSWAQPLASLVAAYATELLLEAVDARAAARRPKYAGGWRVLADFLLPAHISGLAVAMLLYANDRVAAVVFASVAAIASKRLFRAPIGGPAGGGRRHFLNPSNFGITLTLLLFPWVGIAPPYHFTENLAGGGDWALPAIIVLSGSFLNARFTHRVPLILAWLGGFALQALVRSAVWGTPLAAALVPMTGVAFVLYSFYMVTDPATTPEAPRAQVAFGLAVAAAYGLLVASHVVFGLFFALTAVCAARGVGLHALARTGRRARAAAGAAVPAALAPPVVIPGGAAALPAVLPAAPSMTLGTAERTVLAEGGRR